MSPLLLPLILVATQAPQDGMELVRRYDNVMSPGAFEAEAQMTATREDGTTRTYVMHVLKLGTDKLRATFVQPSSAKGQEMLRSGENLWLYMPNLKRSVRMASRDSFMGGDFNNADVLRVNYEADYTASVLPSDDKALVVVELKARNASVAYDKIVLSMTNDKLPQPVKALFFAASGKLLRTADFLDVKDYGGGVVRPSRIVMKNELVPARKSEMAWSSIKLRPDLSPQRFVVDDLGR